MMHHHHHHVDVLNAIGTLIAAAGTGFVFAALLLTVLGWS